MILKEIICNCKSAFPSQGETTISKYIKIETVLFFFKFKSLNHICHLKNAALVRLLEKYHIILLWWVGGIQEHQRYCFSRHTHVYLSYTVFLLKFMADQVIFNLLWAARKYLQACLSFQLLIETINAGFCTNWLDEQDSKCPQKVKSVFH